MKFDYQGIILRIKNTLENIYKKANCRGNIFIVMLVFDTRIGQSKYSEYVADDVIRLVSTERKYAAGVKKMIDSSHMKPSPDEKLTAKELCAIFKAYCQEFSSPIFSDVYNVCESEMFKTDVSSPASQSIGHSQDDRYLKGIVAVCSKTERINHDDFLVDAIQGLSSNFYEIITNEYLRCFATGIVNNVVSQSASLPTNILTAAGVKYVNFFGKALSASGSYGRHDDFVYSINKIAELAYESSEACGRIIFCDEEIPDEYTLLKFKTPYKLNNHTLVRKLLQIVDAGYCLGATRDSIYGIISDVQLEEYRMQRQILFAVDFERERIWALSYCGNLAKTPVKIFVSEYESYKYVEEKLDHDRIKKVFAGFSGGHEEDVFKIIDSAVDSCNGTMIVFSKDAESETHRLRSTGIPLKTPIALGNSENSELVKFITSIDGAVLCDEAGICYAIGVILDGFSSPDDDSNEDISHGARHNSAYRYLRGHKDRCIITVISEDGRISVIA